MNRHVSDFIFMMLLFLFALLVMSYMNYAFACVSECTYTGDVTHWRGECYSVARCVDRQLDGYGSCFVASEYFKLETVSCNDIISDTLELKDGEEFCKEQDRELCGR